MFASLHYHLPGPSDDVEHSAYPPRVQQHPRDRQMLMHENTHVWSLYFTLKVFSLTGPMARVPIKMCTKVNLPLLWLEEYDVFNF